LTVEDGAMKARCIEAMRVAFNHSVSLRLDFEPTQCAQDHLHQAAPVNVTVQLHEANDQDIATLQRAPNALAPAYFSGLVHLP
jgi:hypothetical protein